jgi:Na+-translocating ferredoxin:NAD+ oxidoreductase subunit E
MNKSEQRPGFFNQNPVFGLALGLCPALAITTTLKNAVGMGVVVLCVLVASNTTVSLFHRWIPYKVRIPCFLIIIATFVSMADLLMKANFPGIERNLGIFVPLMAVNCIIIGRVETFASKNKVGPSIIDAAKTGLGFCMALLLCAFIRETLGANSFFGVPFVPHAAPLQALQYACGGFFSIALVLGVMNYVKLTRGKKR